MGLFNFLNKKQPIKVLGREVNIEALAEITDGDKAFDNKNFETAIKKYTKAIEIDDKNWYSFNKRGHCYKAIQSFEKAIQDFLKSKSLSGNYENNYGIAQCYFLRAEYKKASEYFDIAINMVEEMERIDINNMSGYHFGASKAIALNDLAVCYSNLENFIAAIECTTKGISANPEYVGNYVVRGSCYLRVGDIAKAKIDLQKAVKLGYTDAQTVLNNL